MWLPLLVVFGTVKFRSLESGSFSGRKQQTTSPCGFLQLTAHPFCKREETTSQTWPLWQVNFSSFLPQDSPKKENWTNDKLPSKTLDYFTFVQYEDNTKCSCNLYKQVEKTIYRATQLQTGIDRIIICLVISMIVFFCLFYLLLFIHFLPHNKRLIQIFALYFC